MIEMESSIHALSISLLLGAVILRMEFQSYQYVYKIFLILFAEDIYAFDHKHVFYSLHEILLNHNNIHR